MTPDEHNTQFKRSLGFGIFAVAGASAFVLALWILSIGMAYVYPPIFADMPSFVENLAPFAVVAIVAITFVEIIDGDESNEQ